MSIGCWNIDNDPASWKIVSSVLKLFFIKCQWSSSVFQFDHAIVFDEWIPDEIKKNIYYFRIRMVVWFPIQTLETKFVHNICFVGDIIYHPG